jgi:hypothetical protein
MAKRPNYGQERAERQRRKAARRDERLAAKADRRDRGRPDDGAPLLAPNTDAPAAVEDFDASMPADPAMIVRLGQALGYVCGAEHPITLAVQRAAISGDGDDVERARVLFLQLLPGDRRAALVLARATPSALR